MSANSNMPEDFSYKWEPVGAGFLCAFCSPGANHLHLWRAYSEKYGQAYVCPRHLHHIQTGLGGEGRAVWLAIRASGVKRTQERQEMLHNDASND